VRWSTIVFARSKAAACGVAAGQPGFAGKRFVHAGVLPTSTRHFVVKWAHAVDGSLRAQRWWVDHIPTVVVAESTTFGARTEVTKASDLLRTTGEPDGAAASWLVGSSEAAKLRRRHGAPDDMPVWLFVCTTAD
jgi:hypothetical protein